MLEIILKHFSNLVKCLKIVMHKDLDDVPEIVEVGSDLS